MGLRNELRLSRQQERGQLGQKHRVEVSHAGAEVSVCCQRSWSLAVMHHYCVCVCVWVGVCVREFVCICSSVIKPDFQLLYELLDVTIMQKNLSEKPSVILLVLNYCNY